DTPPLEAALATALLSPQSLLDDVPASLNATEMAKRQFREIARVAGLVFPGLPRAGKTARQLQASSSLFFDVFRQYDPGNLLLSQAHREVLERQLESSRLGRTLERLSSAEVVITTPRRVFLGDLLHGREGRSPETLRVVEEWRAAHGALDVILVRGNHDRSAGDPPESLGIGCVDAPLLDGPFAFAHHPMEIGGSYVL